MRPVLAATSKEIILVGKVGDATVIKIATNMVTAASVQAAAEALALIVKSGLPVEKFADAMRNNGSNSPTLDMKLPMMIEGNFEPHFSVKHMLKDVLIATRLARALGVEFGATEASRQGLVGEMRQARGDDDYSSLVRQYFPAGHSLKSGQQVSNEEDDQPQFTGLDDGKTAETEANPEAPPTPVPGTTTAIAEEQVAVIPASDDINTQKPAEATHQMANVRDSALQPAVALQPPEIGDGNGDVGGVWGSFWRRGMDD